MNTRQKWQMDGIILEKKRLKYMDVTTAMPHLEIQERVRGDGVEKFPLSQFTFSPFSHSAIFRATSFLIPSHPFLLCNPHHPPSYEKAFLDGHSSVQILFI